MAATIAIKITTDSDGGLDKAKRDVAELGETARKSGDGFSALGSIATGILQGIGQAAFGAMQAAGQAVAGFVADSIGAAADFEAGMNQFKVAAGDMGQAELTEFKDLFIDLGKELPVSTADVQAAATELVKGGLEPAVVAGGALESTLKFAAAAGMELEEAATLSIKSMQSFVAVGADAATQTEFLAMAQEAMVRAAGASTVNVDELGAAMLAASGQAGALQVDYEDFATTMGLISGGFNSTAEAGTSYKNFLARLQPTTATATQMMMDLGLVTEDGKNAFFDATGAFVGNRQAAEALQTALEGLSPQQRALALQTIFGNDAMGAANALANQGAEGYDIFAQKMADANGISATTAITQQGLTSAWNNLTGSLEALQITVGSAVLPVLTQLTTWASGAVGQIIDFAGAVTSSSDPLNQLIPGLSGVAAAAQALGTAFITWVTPYAQQLATAFQTQIIPAAMAVWSVFTGQVIPILMSLAPILQALVEGALTIFASFWTNILVPALSTVWSFLTTNVLPILAQLATWLGETLPPLIQKVADFFSGTFYPAIKTVAEYLSGTVLPALTNIVALGFNVVVTAIADAVLWLNEKLQPAFAAVSDFITGTALPALEGLQPVMTTLSEVAGSVSGAFDGIAKAIGTAVGAVKDFIEAAAKVKVPSLITPGSPTPLELGFRGIGAGLQVATAAMPAFSQGLERAVTPVTNNTQNYYYSPTYGAAPQRPQNDFLMMRAIATAGV